MAKLTLDGLTNLNNPTSAVNTINENNQKIVKAMEKTLSRDGTTPNNMQSDLDMDEHKIFNLPRPTSNTEPLRLGDINELSSYLETLPPLLAELEELLSSYEITSKSFLGDGGTTTFDLQTAPGNPDAVIVSINGVLQHQSAYSINDEDLIFSEAPPVDAAIEVRILGFRLPSFSGGGGSSGNTSPVYQNVSEVINNPPSLSISSVQTLGYQVAGDQGGAIYKRYGTTNPPHAGYFTDITGYRWEIASLELTPQMFGAKNDRTQIEATTAAMKNCLAASRVLRRPVFLPAGSYAINESLGTYTGLKIRGVGNGFWRAGPPATWFTSDLTYDPLVSEILLCGTGPKEYQVPGVTDNKAIYAYRENPERNYNNEFDAEFCMFDGTNKDASGTTPATLRSFSVGLVIGNSDDQEPSYLENFRMIVNCPDPDTETIGVAGYSKLTEVVPFDDWDFGLWLVDTAMTEIKNVNIIGYYRERGVLMVPGVLGERNGQGEHVHWDGGYIQGGLSVRGGDNWPVIGKTTNAISVRWTASHTFPSSGTIYTSNAGAKTYTSLTYFDSLPLGPRLTFSGISDTSGITVNSTSINSWAGNAGISHSKFMNMYIADQGYSTRIEGPNVAALGDKATYFRAAIEDSGDPCRALKFENVTPIVNGPIAFHFGRAWNVELDQVYVEAKSWKLAVGESNQDVGCIFLVGPPADKISEIGTDNMSDLTIKGYSMTGPVNCMPYYGPPTSGARLSTMDDVFNPRAAINERWLHGLNSSSTTTMDHILYGNNNQSIGLYRRDADGGRHRVIEGLASGNIIIGPTDLGLVVFGSGNAELHGQFRPVDIRLDGGDGPVITFGSGSPEGNVSAVVGSLYLRTDGGTTNAVYIKTSGSGSSGWSNVDVT